MTICKRYSNGQLRDLLTEFLRDIKMSKTRKVAVDSGMWFFGFSCYQSHVDVMRAAAAQPFELLFLQNAQKFRLQGQRQVPDFVQKESAVMCHFKAADFLRHCPHQNKIPSGINLWCPPLKTQGWGSLFYFGGKGRPPANRL